MFSVEGKTAFITGGTSGIGLAVAERFVRQGAKVFIAGRRDAGDLAAGIGATAVQLDVANGDLFAHVLDVVEEDVGKIHILINNAGMENVGQTLVEQAISELDPAVDVNLKGVVHGLKYGPAHMADGGSIINTSSLAANIGLPTYGFYAATKAAVLSLTRTAALELAPRNIRVNAVCPGSIRTAMLPDDHPEVKLTETLCPMGRIGETDDLLGLYQFLASGASAYISGQAINVDGGVSAGFGYGVLGLAETAVS
ncbi:SDR family NAD(P)-dependent oxidoreductase [Emcibacter sp.]|uniref:SDR family NAD(P)-dependent oxidoreductase n=1 Tax=Emcibacter sp. TaxID=1979954 RepID=UPI003A9577CD